MVHMLTWVACLRGWRGKVGGVGDVPGFVKSNVGGVLAWVARVGWAGC